LRKIRHGKVRFPYFFSHPRNQLIQIPCGYVFFQNHSEQPRGLNGLVRGRSRHRDIGTVWTNVVPAHARYVAIVVNGFRPARCVQIQRNSKEPLHGLLEL
jgi:hypothetical protein